MLKQGSWEYVTRNTGRPAVAVVAITDEDRVVLVEQYRPPVNRMALEIPAGLAGDMDGTEDESLLEAARRELIEETGYSASRWTRLGSGFSSPGLTDESIAMFLAEGLERVGLGGGDEHEQIRVHEVAWEDLPIWLAEREDQLDIKLLAAVFLADLERKKRMR